MLLALALVSAPCAPQMRGHSDLQPSTCTSPDGRWSLSVDPSHRDGSGPGQYRCTHDGKELWAGERPWTFWQAIVTDDGFTAGYSYSQDGLEMFSKGDFHAVILAPDGSVRLDESHERKGSNFMHSPPDPRASGLFWQAEPARIVFRIRDADINRGREEWWCFQLPDAKEVFRRCPRESFPDAGLGGSSSKGEKPKLSVCAALGVPGTKTTLIEWSRFDYPEIGIALSLHDADLKCLWSSTFLGELTDPNEDRADFIRTTVYQRGSLLGAPARGSFAVGLPRSEKKVTFVVEPGAQGIEVRESAREPWNLNPEEPQGARLADVPVADLKDKGAVELQMAAPAAGPVHDICTFAFASADALRFIRSDAKGEHHALVRVDLKGSVQAEQTFEIPELQPDQQLGFWELGPGSWLATQSPYGEGGQARAWRIEEQGGVVTRLEAFRCAAIEDIAPLGGGAFVALATERGKYTMSTGLFAFSADGEPTWHVSEDLNSDEPGALFSPEAIAVTTDGVVVVLDVIRHTLQFFRADGHYERTLELDKIIGHEANYPSGLRPDVEGGLLVHDFHGTPPLLRLKRDGTLRSSASPRFQDGKVVDGLTRYARVAPDGRLWATDDQRLLRMDEQGVVDLQIGSKADADVLAEPSASTIDVFGRVLVQDGTTGAVHVFDGKGKRLFVCRPDPTDFKDPSSIVHLAATKDRGVLAEAGDGLSAPYIEFRSDGTRKGKIALGEDLQNPVCSPASDATFAGDYGQGFVQLDGARKISARFQRAPDGYWLEGSQEPAVAPDGAVAVVSALGVGGSEGGGSLVLFETADPKAGRSIGIPADAPCYRLALGKKWAVASGFGNEALLVRREDGKLLRFRVSTEVKEGGSCCFGFDPETGDLLAFEAAAHKLHRYAMP